MKPGILLCVLAVASGLDNGFRLPALGWSSWYASPSGSQVTDQFVRASTNALIKSGLASKGFVYVNVDEGWLKGRWPNGSIYEDRQKFPAGMKALGDWVRSQSIIPGDHSGATMKYGLYSCRGTCQCGTRFYHGPGSHGYEAADTAWMIAAGAEWLKIDSCCGSQDHAVAFADYAKFRDAMNASGKAVWFNLCGWESWYAPPDPAIKYLGGGSLGNSWRIYGDGGNFRAITGALNTMAKLTNYTSPGAYSDPDNILGPHGTVGRVSESQARLQMVMWSLYPTQLILGEDVTQMSSEYIATVGNEELIAVNQDSPFISAARRIVGGDLSFPCTDSSGAVAAVEAQKCQGTVASQQQVFYWNSTDSSLRSPKAPGALLSTTNCDFKNGNIVGFFAPGAGGTACGGARWTRAPGTNSTIIGARGMCLDEYEFTTPRVDLWACERDARNEMWMWRPTDTYFDRFPMGAITNVDSGNCLTVVPPSPAQECTNVWARPLSNGDVGMAFLNNGNANTTVVCDASCFEAAGLGEAQKLAVRDMLAHADLPHITPPFRFSHVVGADGAAAAFRFSVL